MKKIAEGLFLIRFRRFGSLVYFYPDECVIVDTSSYINREFLLYELSNASLPPADIKYVYVTHPHFDHIGNLDLFSKSRIIASQRTQEIIQYGEENYMHFYKFGENPPVLEGYDFRYMDTERFKLYETSGHEQGSICIYDTYLKVLFTGDSIFTKGTLPRLDLKGSDKEMLKERYRKLYEENLDVRLVCPGHGDIQFFDDFPGYLDNLIKKLD